MDSINGFYSTNSNFYNNINLYSSMVNYSIMTESSQSIADMFQNDNLIYNQYLNTDYLETFKSELSSLESSSEFLITSETDSVFKERTASSSNTTILTAQAETKAAKTDYNVDITQLAQIQRNQSSSLDSDADAVNNFQTGDNIFKITQGGTETQITVNVDSTAANSDVLRKMESKINNSDLNLTAKVISNGDGTSYLEVESTNTGTDYSFSISDISQDLAASSGITTTTQTAQDANYTIDGSSYTSGANEVTIDSGKVTLNLKSIGSAEVAVANNTEEITNQIESFVEDYNKTIDFLNSNPMNENATELGDQISNISQDSEYQLENIGIDVSADGHLSINEDQLATALKENLEQVKDTLGNTPGVAAEIHSQTEETLTNPISKYSELQTYSLYNPTGQTSYFQPNMSGLLFDFYL